MTRPAVRVLLLGVVLALTSWMCLSPTSPPVAAAPGDTIRVSVIHGGAESLPSALSYPPGMRRVAISEDGSVVAFVSAAQNLVGSDSNTCPGFDAVPGQCPDIFLHNASTLATVRVSVSNTNVQANGASDQPSLNGTGQVIAFQSKATNLIADDVNGSVEDCFVRDLRVPTTRLVHRSTANVQGNAACSTPVISADARYVAYVSRSTNLVTPGGGGTAHIYRFSLTDDTVMRVSVDASGIPANADSDHPSISADGRYVAFASAATNLLPGDNNNHRDVFVRDMVANTVTRVSVNDGGIQGDQPSDRPSISADGRYVSFTSQATNLVSGDSNTCGSFTVQGSCPDIFLRDVIGGTTRRVSVATGGAQSNGESVMSAISADGRFTAFESLAANLAPGDAKGVTQIYAFDRITGVTTRMSVSSMNEAATHAAGSVAINGDGRFVAFGSLAANLITTDNNNGHDVFRREQAISGFVSGRIALAWRSPTTPPNAFDSTGYSMTTLTATRVPGGTPVNVPVAADGSFLLLVQQSGTYTFTAAAPGYLTTTRSVTVVDGIVPGGVPLVTLRAGAVNADAVVNLHDLTAVLASFGAALPHRRDGLGRVVDLNSDGVVTIDDVIIVITSFGQRAPQPWP